MNTVRIALCLIVAGISSGATPQSRDSVPQLLRESRSGAAQFLERLGGELRREMETTGPMRSIIVCKFSAPEVASAISRQTGWRVSRVGLRTRNPSLGQPGVWEHRVLQEFDRRVAHALA